ncbi:hypothetical protein BV20DRAFT_1049351 [Pilatotrama ljubarskyi]|nr:hypothetical protein BV20DRAFT_1049351 [Pilatotrama ljubarskyi]
MAPLFAKLFSQRSSSQSTRSDRRSSVDSYDSSESYVISLPAIYPAAASLSPVNSTTSSVQSAEMIDDDNLAWGRPSRFGSRRS